MIGGLTRGDNLLAAGISHFSTSEMDAEHT